MSGRSLARGDAGRFIEVPAKSCHAWASLLEPCLAAHSLWHPSPLKACTLGTICMEGLPSVLPSHVLFFRSVSVRNPAPQAQATFFRPIQSSGLCQPRRAPPLQSLLHVCSSRPPQARVSPHSSWNSDPMT